MKRAWMLWLAMLLPALPAMAGGSGAMKGVAGGGHLDKATSQPPVLAIAKELVCDCPDCGKQALDQCTDCAQGRKYRAEIGALLAQGQTKQQILDHFGDKYGEQLLGNPRPHGFGRAAATVPYAAALLGLIPLGLLLRRRRSTPIKPAAPTLPAADDARLAAALNDFDF